MPSDIDVLKDKALDAAAMTAGAGLADKLLTNPVLAILNASISEAKDLKLSDITQIKKELAAIGKHPNVHSTNDIINILLARDNAKSRKIMDDILKGNSRAQRQLELIKKTQPKAVYESMYARARKAAQDVILGKASMNMPFTTALGKRPLVVHRNSLPFFLHEIGHVKNLDILNRLSTEIPRRDIGKVGRIAAPFLGKASLGPYAELMGWAPTLLDEGLASAKAVHWTAKNKGIRPALKATSVLGKAFGTYLTMPILALLGAKAGLYAKDKIMEVYSNTKQEKQAAFIIGFKKTAAELLHSNPMKPQKDLVTPEINAGNRKIREGVKTNLQHSQQITSKKKAPQAQFQAKLAFIGRLAAGASKLVPAALKRLGGRTVSSLVAGIPGVGQALAGRVGSMSNLAHGISAKARTMGSGYLASKAKTVKALGSAYKSSVKSAPSWFKPVTVGGAATYGAVGYGLNKALG